MTAFDVREDGIAAGGHVVQDEAVIVVAGVVVEPVGADRAISGAVIIGTRASAGGSRRLRHRTGIRGFDPASSVPRVPTGTLSAWRTGGRPTRTTGPAMWTARDQADADRPIPLHVSETGWSSTIPMSHANGSFVSNSSASSIWLRCSPTTSP